MRLAVVISHPIQYYAPIFKELAKRCDLHVFFGQEALMSKQAKTGFGVAFEWDVDLRDGYESSVLRNVATSPSLDKFFGADTPEIAQALKAGQFDALLVLGWYQKMFLQAIAAAKYLRLPVIVRGDSNLSMPRGRARQALQRIAYPRLLRVFNGAAYVGALSREFYEHYGFPSDRLFFSPHCVDNAFFAQRATPAAGATLRAVHGVGPEENLVLFAGKLVPFKRPLDILEAVSHMRAQGILTRAVFAGSGELEPALRQRDAELKVDSMFLGFLNQTELPAAYAAADVLALPSTGRETWGLVCNEALAAGLPIVVADDIGCAPDLAADGVVGRTYFGGDPTALAAALAATLASPPPIEAARALADRYSVARAVDGIEAAAAVVNSSVSTV